MNEDLDNVCTQCDVHPGMLMEKIDDALAGVSISHFSDNELRVLVSALAILGVSHEG